MIPLDLADIAAGIGALVIGGQDAGDLSGGIEVADLAFRPIDGGRGVGTLALSGSGIDAGSHLHRQ